MMEFTEDLQSEIIILAEKLSLAKLDEAKILLAIADAARYSSEKKLENSVIRYAGESERNFLEGKQLCVMTRTGRTASTYDYHAMGTTEDFPCSLTRDDDIWEFYLPPAPSLKNGKFGRDVGRYSGYLVKNLISTYEEQIDRIEKLYSPVIVFEYGLSGINALSKKFDPDNRDSKRMIDAMTGKFFNDDNVLEIKTVHYGVVSEESYTRIFLMESSVFSTFIGKNSHW